MPNHKFISFPNKIRKSDSRVYPYNLELNEVNLLNFTLSQLQLKNRVAWFIHFCQETACLQEAQRHIGAQIIIIDHQIRSLRYRLRWSIESDRMAMTQLRSLLKERYFFQELGYSVRKTVVRTLRRKEPDDYPDGVRLAAHA